MIYIYVLVNILLQANGIVVILLQENDLLIDKKLFYLAEFYDN